MGTGTAVGPVLKFGVAFPLVYHYVAGIRHVIWDKYVYGFNNDAMHQSSLLVAGSSLAISGDLLFHRFFLLDLRLIRNSK